MINIENVNFSYSNSDSILKNINLQIPNGEAIALVGLSGSGKTTLTRIINGLAYRFYEGKLEGEIKIDDIDLKTKELYEIGKLIGSIFQNPKSQFFAQLVEDEIAFGPENYGVEGSSIDNIVDRALISINGYNLKGKNLFNLSSGEKQKIAIASINAINPPIYLFDEPTANLDMQSVEALKELMLNLKRCGKTLIVSEHRLYYLKEIIDKFYYMKNGRIIDCKTNQEFFENEAENKSNGLRSLKLENIVPTGERIIGSNRLEIKELSFSYRETKIFQNINYSFSSGNIYGIAGNNGVGKSTLGKILSGILDCKSGKVIYNTKPLRKNERRKMIYYLSNNPDSNLFGVSAQEELELNCKNCDVEAILENYNLAEFKNTHPQILSGGQKQRLTIAQSELLDRDVYILDEPTSGLDAKNMEIIANRIKEFQAKDKIILIISHDYEFLMKICTDICWLNRDNILSLDPKTQRDLILKLLMKGE